MSDIDYSKLKEEIPYKWRVQSQNEHGAQCVAYIDARQAADKLDEVVGPQNWQCDYKVINDNLYGSVSIRSKYGEWVNKVDCGTESKVDKEKGEASDAFKRAAVKWGIGRFLYEKGFERVKVKEYKGKSYPCDDKGNILWDGDALTEYINNRRKNPSKRYETPKKEPTYNTPDKPEWSEATKERAGKVKKEGLTGSAALVRYIDDFNKKNKTSYKSILEFNTDELLGKLIDFVEEEPPTGLV